MPQPVAEIEHPAAIVTPERFLVLVEIGRILHVERQPALGRGCNMAAGRGLERTKVAGKCALFIVGQAVIVEHQYGVAVHAGLDRVDFITRQRPRDVHTGHLAGELGIERANAECHHERFLFDGHDHNIMWRFAILLLAVLASMHCSTASAQTAVPDGTWLVGQRVAFDIFACKASLCGRIVWLRNPALRTAEMCGRTIIWGLNQDGPSQWSGGWFFDPDNGTTYNVSAQVENRDLISARIYKGISLFGRTEILTRITARSLSGWCGT